jgi:hypothetical protein
MKSPFEQYLRRYHPHTTDPAVLRAWEFFTEPLDQRYEAWTLALLPFLDAFDPTHGPDDYQFHEEGFITVEGDVLRVETPYMQSAECVRRDFRDELAAFVAAYEAWKQQ